MDESIKHINKLTQKAVIDIYLSGGNGRFYWPNRLQPAKKGDSTPSVRESSQQYMLDSGFEDGGVPTKQLIEMTHERQPDYVIPNDVVNTPDVEMRNAIEGTAKKVDEFLSLIDEKTFPATVLIPLQPPHDFHYGFLHKHYPEQIKRSHFALGGMKDMKPKLQIKYVKQFRRVIGYNAYVHGFGLGASRQLVKALRDDPRLLDAVDFSTPQIHARSGQIAGHARIPQYIGTGKGNDLSTTTGKLIQAEMCEIARMLNLDISDEQIEIKWTKFKKQYESLERKLMEEGVLGEDQTKEENQVGLERFDTTG